MTITELIAALEDIRASEGDLQVLCPDQGSTDACSVVRVENARVTGAFIYDLGNGAAGLTLDDEAAGAEPTPLRVVLLD